jgi:flagella basal body P-ring formation protein FlgA
MISSRWLNSLVYLSFFGAGNPCFADLNDLLKPVPGAVGLRDSVSRTSKLDSAIQQTGQNSSPLPVEQKLLTEAELIVAIEKDFPRRFPIKGELKVSLSRPWVPVKLPGADFFAECIQIAGNGLSSNMGFTLRVVSDGKIVGEWPIQVRVELWQDVWVSTQRIDRGMVLDSGLLTQKRLDVLREFVMPLTVDQDLQGFEVNQTVQSGRPITRREIVEKTVVKKGQLVDAVASEGGLNIRMRAIAVEGGPAGAVIRVRNLDSQKEFVAQVLNENQVQVRF